jgi:hypothetical protein
MTSAKNGQPAEKYGTMLGLYDPLDFVVVRAPMLPVEFYHFMCRSSLADHSLLEFLGNKQVLLAVNSTSPSLVSSFHEKLYNRGSAHTTLLALGAPPRH